MSRAAQQTHESYADHAEIKGPSNRSFGLTVGGILCLIAVLRWYWIWAFSPGAAILLALGLALVIFAVLAPDLLSPLNRLWMKFGLLLARIVNPVILFAMFSVAFVPAAIVMRLRKRDALRLKRDPQAASYWIARNPPGPPPDGIVNQF